MSGRRFLFPISLVLILFLSSARADNPDAQATIFISSGPKATDLSNDRIIGVLAGFGGDGKNATISIAELVHVDPPLACSPLKNAVPGAVFLIERGNCSFVNKSRIAQQAGARAVIIYNNDPEGDAISMSGDSADDITIPVIGVSGPDGITLSGPNSQYVATKPYYRPAFDGSAILVLVIAISTVLGGAYWSANKERAHAFGLPPVDRRDEPDAIVNISERAACLWVVVASAALLVIFYFISKFLMYILLTLFCIGGAQGLHAVLYALGKTLTPGRYAEYVMRNIRIPYIGSFTWMSVVMVFPSVAVAAWYAAARTAPYSWFLQDALAISLLLLIQRTLRLPNIKVSAILLTLAFLYDIFWVFLSPFIFKSSVMITVATGGGTGESMPMVIRVPRFSDELHGYSLLGLGDIALPGLFISFLLRYDYCHGRLGWNFKGYFNISAIGYAIGFIITDIVLIATMSGQPALLYLVPCTLYVVLFIAWRRGELMSLVEGTGMADESDARPEESLLPGAPDSAQPASSTADTVDGEVRVSVGTDDDPESGSHSPNERRRMNSGGTYRPVSTSGDDVPASRNANSDESKDHAL